MRAAFIILLIALTAWKAYHAVRRGLSAYRRERTDYVSLTEYLVGNGMTEAGVRLVFLKRAAGRALLPLVRQWQWLAVAALLLLLIYVC